MDNPGPSAPESRRPRLPSYAAALISPQPSIACLAAAASAAVLVLLWQSLTVHYNYSGNWTALFHTGDTYAVPPGLFPGTYIFAETDGYDGMWYRYIAHDPLFRRGLAEFIDVAGIRYRRILVPGLAHLLGAGRPEWIDGAYIAVVWAFVALGVYWCSRYFHTHGRGPAWGLLFLLAPGTLTSIDRMVVDGPLTALFAGFLFYAGTCSWKKAYLIALLAFLTRETGILLIAGLVLHLVLEKQYRRAILSSTAALPARKLLSSHPISLGANIIRVHALSRSDYIVTAQTPAHEQRLTTYDQIQVMLRSRPAMKRALAGLAMARIWITVQCKIRCAFNEPVTTSK